jgi:glutamine synthetase
MASDLTLDKLEATLKDDSAVKVAGVDVDGMLRGKLMAKSKFLSVVEKGNCAL